MNTLIKDLMKEAANVPLRSCVILMFFLAGFLPGKAQDSCMKFSWTSAFSYNSDDKMTTIDADAEGNTYITGIFKDTLIIGRDTLRGLEPGPAIPGRHYSFVAKFDPQGQCLWAVGIPGTGEVSSCAVKVGNNGEIYIAGAFNKTAIFGSDTLTVTTTFPNDYNLFLSTLNGDGTFISTVKNNVTQTTTTTSYSIEQHIRSGITQLAIDGEGNLHLIGSFSGTLRFDNITVTGSIALPYNSPTDLVFAKLKRSGQWAWALVPQSITGDAYYPGMGHTITTDDTGNVYVFGRTSWDVIFGNDTLMHEGSPGGNYRAGTPFYLAKISPAGQWQWATVAGIAGAVGGLQYAEGIVVHPSNGHIFICGVFDVSTGLAVFGNDTLTGRSNFLSHTDSRGQLLWTRPLSGSYSSSLAIAPDNGCYALSFDSSLRAQSINHFSETGTVIGQLPVDTNVLIGWGANFQHPLLASDAAGHLYVTGYIRGGKAAFGDITVEATSNGSFFVAEISCDLPSAVREDLKQPPYFTVYPNPTMGSFTLDFGKPSVSAIIDIYDIQGRLHGSQHIYESQQAALQLDAPPGIYLLQVTTAAGRETRKIIKH